MEAEVRIPTPILELRKGVEAWRRSRAKRGPMPESLWNEAGELAREHGIYAVSRGARLAYDGVKRARGNVANGLTPPEPLPGPFLELQLPPLMSGGEVSEALVVEFRDARGRSLAVRVMPRAVSELPQVAAALWGLS